MMKLRTLTLSAAVLVALAQTASAACFADYKAKKDSPLKLHYGVVELSGKKCALPAAKRQISARIAADGWQLLTVLSVFDETGLAERKASAGQFFLRY